MPSREYSIPIRWVVGGMFVAGGLFHAACPWLFGYKDVTTATASNVASGLALAAVGVARLAVPRAFAWVITAASVVLGFWLLCAPAALGFALVPMAANEALWGGMFTLLFTLFDLLARMVTRPETA